MQKILKTTLLAISFLLYYSNFNALGAAVDTRMAAVILALICLIISGISLYDKRNLFNYSTILVSLFLLAISFQEKYLRYAEKEIEFTSDGFALKGTLFEPFHSSRCLVVFIHGSGQEDRTMYAFHARNLARNGIAAYAYDKRGSGASQGETYGVDYLGYAKDAVNAINEIQNGRHFEKVGLFAVSEGEWVSLIVDTLTTIDFITMISASGTSPMVQTHRELTFRLERKGFGGLDLAAASNLYMEILSFDNDSTKRERIEAALAKNGQEPWFEAGEDFSTELYFYPWWFNVMSFDPQPLLRESNTPILVILGDENESFPSTESISNFRNFSNVETIVIEGGDHALLEWPIGKRIPPPVFATGYLEKYTSWIKNKCGD